MKRKMFRQIMAASLATAMTVGGLAGCGSTPASTTTEEPAQAETKTEEAAPAETTTTEEAAPEDDGILRDENGNVYDLGGMEIIIRNWWSGDPAEPTNDLFFS